MTLRNAVRDRLGDDGRARLRLAEHNLRALRDDDLRRLSARRVDGVWTIDDGQDRIRVPALRRFHRYWNGVRSGCRIVASDYLIGTEIPVHPGDIVLDVGANIGEVSLACAWDGARIYSFEADPSTFRLLTANVGSTPGVQPRQLAVSDRDGTIRFFPQPDSADGSTIGPPDGGGFVEVEATTLDTFAAMEGLDAIHLLKCDAEGAEPEVLAGARDLLTRTTWVTLDCGAERLGEMTIEPCVAALEEAGFDVQVRHIELGRDIVVAHRR